jgi:ribosomal-protein-alanine N-acetyltransferase
MIETNRLYIKPLTYTQLLKYVQGGNQLEEELNLNYNSRIISSELKDALETSILPNVKDKNKNYLFYTLWTVISKIDNKMVADLCFVGEPNNAGEVEIGYGTYKDFQNKGYMTEAVNGMIEWAKNQVNIKSIIASSEKSNTASSKVLEKNNFKKIAETESLYNWKFNIK